MKADIFFFVSTISVVILTLLFGIIMIYVIVLFNRFKNTAAKVEEKFEEMKDKISEVEFNLYNNPIFNLLFSRKRIRSKNKNKEE